MTRPRPVAVEGSWHLSIDIDLTAQKAHLACFGDTVQMMWRVLHSEQLEPCEKVVASEELRICLAVRSWLLNTLIA